MSVNRVIVEASIGGQDLDLIDPTEQVVFNFIFLDTGEIRQKRRSWEWLAKRVFRDELKSWGERRNEKFLFEKTKKE